MGASRKTVLGHRRRRTSRVKAAVSLPSVRLPRGAGAAKRPSWKLVGLAGVAGVAATGVLVARRRRAHSDLQPDELRERLHQRLAGVGGGGDPPPPSSPAA
ncbi:MAG: hypothetical protein WKF42_00545 [Solirubrobacteraceae bacterium]